MPFVYIKDYKYFVCDEILTHIGRRYNTSWTEDLDKATTFYGPADYRLRLSELKNAERLEVVETRIIRLK